MDYSIEYYSDAVADEIVSLLHSFIKKTRKTPKREIEIARKRMREVKHANP